MLKIKDGFKGERSLIIPKMIIDYMEQDPYCQLLYLTDIGYYPKARHHFRERNEPIPQYIFIYCSEGKGWYKYGNSRHEIGPNQYFVLPAGEPHSYGSDPKNPWSIYWFHFNGSVAARNAEGLQVPHTAEPSATSRISDRLSLFEEMLFTIS